KYSLDLTKGIIKGEYATEEETAQAIKAMYDQTGYVMDTHTAVAYAAYEKYKNATGDQTKTVIVSTASPYKFTKDVLVSIDKKYEAMDFFPLMGELEKLSGVEMPIPIKGIESRPILHSTVIERDNIKDFVKEHLTK
ncbi:MAG: threonine synthase, partial [Lachnospiraceae bacterium]|nr:threonine synthase [Lachnospiraceae bacterium]